MAQVFISYARSTAKTTRTIASALEELGHSVWYDQDIPAHRAYADVITEQLESANAVIVLWSAEAAASQWVRSEANRAREMGILVQARVDDSRLPMPFDQIQCVDLRDWRGDRRAPGFQALVRSVAELAGSPAGSSAEGSRPRSANSRVGRRRILIGAGGAILIAAAGGVAWYQPFGKDVPPRARQLFQNAQTIMQDGRPEEQDQATAYLMEATQVAPGFAAAWGVLAITYALRKYQVAAVERPGNEARCRSAARQALDIDTDEPFAQCALALLVAPYRHWAMVEQMGRRLADRHSEIPLTHHILADVLGDVGRTTEAAAIYSRIDRTRFVIPLSERAIIQGLWSSGDLQQAETLLNAAAERWPRHRAIWDLRTDFLMHTGRAGEAIRLLDDAAGRPPAYPENLLKAAQATARALAGKMEPTEAIALNLGILASAPRVFLTYLNHKIATAQVVAQRAAALGDHDTAFALLEGYYFGRGQWAQAAPPAGNDDRNSVPLFEPPGRALWRDPRFATLVAEIGLERYWRETSSQPDFKKA